MKVYQLPPAGPTIKPHIRVTADWNWHSVAMPNGGDHALFLRACDWIDALTAKHTHGFRVSFDTTYREN